ncbi:MAG: hypothetical protein JW716_02075 [Candidatus Aenigmarchaeota archaeon]|nr:hypothetical protein [Candidatus Aenigmarchaeota archaeon]
MELINYLLAPLDVAIKTFIYRPLGYMTGHVFERLDAHDEARNGYLSKRVRR